LKLILFIFLIFSFLIYLIIKSLIRGLNGRNRNKKKSLKKYY
jgi:hypothetical protein